MTCPEQEEASCPMWMTIGVRSVYVSFNLCIDTILIPDTPHSKGSNIPVIFYDPFNFSLCVLCPSLASPFSIIVRPLQFRETRETPVRLLPRKPESLVCVMQGSVLSLCLITKLTQTRLVSLRYRSSKT